MDHIVVKVSDLRNLVEMMTEDKVEYAQIFLMEADEDMPAYLAPSGFSASGTMSVDYDGIDAVEDVAPPSFSTNIR